MFFSQVNLCFLWLNSWQLSAAPQGRIKTKNSENVSRYISYYILFYHGITSFPPSLFFKKVPTKIWILKMSVGICHPSIQQYFYFPHSSQISLLYVLQKVKIERMIWISFMKLKSCKEFTWTGAFEVPNPHISLFSLISCATSLAVAFSVSLFDLWNLILVQLGHWRHWEAFGSS